MITRTEVQNPKEFRVVYQETLSGLMGELPQVVAMDADLVGASGTAKLFKAYADRCINAGISEANMMGMAAGMSLTGKVPFIHTFAPFATRRIFDQLYMAGVYQHANVKIYGSDPGFWALHNGGTHTSMEDLALTRSLPNLTVLAPSDATQFAWCLRKAATTEGCFYIRAGRKAFKDLYASTSTFELGQAITVEPGHDIVIFAIGEMVAESLKVREALAADGLSVQVVDCFSIKPFDVQGVLAAAQGKRLVVTAENHSMIGGLGSAVAEVLADHGLGIPLVRVAVQDRFGEVGTPDYLQKILGLDAPSMIAAIQSKL